MERGRTWDAEESKYFGNRAAAFLFDLPSLEEVNLRGVPPRELSIILEDLCSPPYFLGSPCPSLKRLHVESMPLHSPRSLLVGFGRRIADRNEAGVPFESVAVKVMCETLIPATDHCAFLASWEGFVEGVRLEYERTEVKRLPGCHRYDCGCGDKDDKDGGAGIENPDDHCVGWDGWPENWPKTTEEMRRWQAEST